MAKIREIDDEPDWQYSYTCPKCGNHIGKRVFLKAHKFNGGISPRPKSLLICSRCNYTEWLDD